MSRLDGSQVEAATLQSRSVIRFVGGVLTIILASVLGSTVGGYLISFIWIGPHPFWQPIDKNVGLESAIDGIIVGHILGMAGLAWLSSCRRSWAFVPGGLAAVAAEVTLFLLLVGPRY